MISFLLLMAQLLLIAIVAGVISGGAVGFVATELALWWHDMGRYGDREVQP